MQLNAAKLTTHFFKETTRQFIATKEMVKQLYNILFFACLSMAVCTACSDIEESSLQMDEVEVPVIFGFTRNGEQEVNVKDDKETAIYTLRLLVFNQANGKCELNYYTDDQTEINEICQGKRSFLALSGQKNIVAIANEANNGFTNWTIDLDNEATLTYNALKEATTATNQAPTINENKPVALFMSGETSQFLLPNKTMSDPNRVVNLYLDRACAKLSVTVTKSDKALPYTMTLKKMTIMQGGGQFKVMTDSYQYSNANFETLPNYSKTPAVVINDKAASEEFHTKNTLYSYERYVADQKDESTYLEMVVSIESGNGAETEERTAKIYFNDNGAYNLVRNTQYNINVNINNVDMSKLEIQCSITPWNVRSIDINSRPTTAMPMSNCYIVKPNTTINIPVLKANNDGIERIGVMDDLEAVFVWDSGYNNGGSLQGGELNIKSQIAELEIIGTGSSALLSVTTGNELGNAMMAVRNKRTDKIAWSWHIWVTNYDPDEAVADFQFVRGETSTTGNNDNISWHLDEVNEGAGGNLYMYMKNTLGYVVHSNGNWNNATSGLFYQWGRKDPFADWGVTIFPNNDNNNLDMIGSQGLELSIENPRNRASGYGYFGAEQQYKNLWQPEDGSKSNYDPCPIGWRLPSQSEFLDKVNLSSNIWTASYDTMDYSKRIILNNQGYGNWASPHDTWNLRCIREGSIKVPAIPEQPKNLMIEWEQGIIDPLGSDAERERTQFSVKAYYDNAPGITLTSGITYTWYIDNSPADATTNNYYDHKVARFKDQSILLKCRAVDSEGRVAETSAEWMVMKRPFVNASLVTFQNSKDYLTGEAAYINQDPANRSRVRYLRDPLSSNVYRVKLMKDGKWWMVQDYREAKSTYVANNSNDHIEGKSYFYKIGNTSPCPTGWRLPTNDELQEILGSSDINQGSGGSAKYKDLPAIANDNYRGTNEYNNSHFEAQINGYATSGSSINMGGYSSYIVTSRILKTHYLFEVIKSDTKLQWRIQTNNSNYHSVRCIQDN